MCGIVGYLSGHGNKGWPQDRGKFLKQGLIVDSLRGMDSTGLFTVEKGDEKEGAYWLKNAVTGGQFVASDRYRKAMTHPQDFRAAIGHNRAATLGAVTTKNAHPFVEGPITLVHNGTLNSTHGMPLPLKELEKTKGVEVDSHAIAHNLAHEPITEWYSRMYGAWALVWHDSRDGSLNMVRNSQRPLHIAQVEREDTILIASEADMLAFLANRINIFTNDVLSLKTNHLFTWYPDTPVMEPEVTELQTGHYDTGWGKGGYYGGRKYHEGANGVMYPERSSRGSAYSSAPFVPPVEMLLCGKMRPVPDIHQLELFDLGLQVEDKLRFKPGAIIHRGGNHRPMTVAGFLEKAGLPCILYGAPSSADYAVGLPKTAWTVRPIAVYYPDYVGKDDLPGPYIVCRHVYSYWLEPREEIPHTPTPEYQKAENSLITAVGPNNKRIPIEEFTKIVLDGCIKCKAVISYLDDEDMAWDTKGKPVCPDCAAQLRRVN